MTRVSLRLGTFAVWFFDLENQNGLLQLFGKSELIDQWLFHNQIGTKVQYTSYMFPKWIETTFTETWIVPFRIKLILWTKPYKLPLLSNVLLKITKIKPKLGIIMVKIIITEINRWNKLNCTKKNSTVTDCSQFDLVLFVNFSSQFSSFRYVLVQFSSIYFLFF